MKRNRGARPLGGLAGGNLPVPEQRPRTGEVVQNSVAGAGVAVGESGAGGRRNGPLRRVLLSFLAMALCLGTLGTTFAAVVLSSPSPAGATGAGVTESMACWAVPSGAGAGHTTAGTANLKLQGTATPPSILPGGTFKFTFTPTGVQNVPTDTGGYPDEGKRTWTTRLATPAGTTVVNGPTVVSPGYYFNPSTPGTHVSSGTVVSLVADSNAPGGYIVKEHTSLQIPGGDDFVTPTVSITLKAPTHPTSSTIGMGLVQVLPVGTTHKSTDPAYQNTTKTTAGIGGVVTTVSTCWPFPVPQPPFAVVHIIDTVSPTINIATPGTGSTASHNAKVHAVFTCNDPAVYGNGIKSCTATNTGTLVAEGGLITTSVLGTHTFKVHAVNNSTYSSTETSHYTVIVPPYNLTPPIVTVTSPTNGAQYVTGSTVDAAFSCAAQGGTTIASCTATVATGTPISTTAGYHTFTVKAIDRRGNPTTQTVGYYGRASNSAHNTPSSDKVVGYATKTSNNECSFGHTYYSFLLGGGTEHTCIFGAHTPEADWQVTAPAANGGQVAVGDKIHVKQQIFRPGAEGVSGQGGYYTGPYKATIQVTAPAHTVITGTITSSKTGITSTNYGKGTSQAASACNYDNAASATGASGRFCNQSLPNVASTTATPGGSTTVGAYGTASIGAYGSSSVGAYGSTSVGAYGHTTVPAAAGTTVGAYGSTSIGAYGSTKIASSGGTTIAPQATSTIGTYAKTTVGAYGSTTVGTLFTTTVTTKSNGKALTTAKLHVTSVTGAPTTGHLEVKTSTTQIAVLAYTGHSTSTGTCGTSAQPCFTGVSVVKTATGTFSTGKVVRQPLTAAATHLTVLPVAATAGFTTAGQVTVATTGTTAVFNYTGSSTTAKVCGTTPCLTGVSYSSGTGTIAKPNAVNQVNPTVSSFTGSGIIHAAAVSAFKSAGTITVVTSAGTEKLAYTGTSTAAGTCGSAACFTGVTAKTGATGFSTVGGAIKQSTPNVASFTGAGVLPVAATAGFLPRGSLTVATGSGTVTVSYTGTSTTATTCGAAACFTGVTVHAGTTGLATAGGAITQIAPTVHTFSGSGILQAVTVTGFTASGALSVTTATGHVNVTYTGTSTSAATCGNTACFKGVSVLAGGSGRLVAGGAIAQQAVTVSSFTGSGILQTTSVTGFTTAGTLKVVTSTGPVTVSYTSTSTVVATCGSPACFKGVAVKNSGVGHLTGGGTVSQIVPTVASFTGTGVLHATSVTGFTSAGTGVLTVTTASGPVTVTYTGTSTTVGTCGSAACFTGVTVQNGGSGLLTSAGAISQANPTVASFTSGSGLLHAAATTGFSPSGRISVATSTGTADLSYTSVASSTATCGSAACFKGVRIISGSGIPAFGGAITQLLSTAHTFTGTGVLPASSVTGFTTAGTLTVGTATGPVTMSYTGTSTSATTCGAAACFTGVTTAGGVHGQLTGGNTDTIVQRVKTAATFTGSGVVPATAVTGFTTAGTLTVTTATGPVVLSYTGTSTTAGTCGAAHCFIGVGHKSGTGLIGNTDTIVQRVKTAATLPAPAWCRPPPSPASPRLAH